MNKRELLKREIQFNWTGAFKLTLVGEDTSHCWEPWAVSTAHGRKSEATI